MTKDFVNELRNMLQLNIETVEEAVSTIEAQQIYINNKNKKKDYKKLIDSVAAAVILRRIID
jgi:RNase H-fold protein (predicted Holliday junction resolvase)